MQRDREFFLDILEAAKLAISYVDDKSKEDFLRDSQCQDAVVRRFGIIGEASRRISDETRASHPELPWGEMIAMRNVMIHEYDDVDFTVVWETVKNNLPALIDSLERILSD
ncbi:MAG: DUF86 domain-containing protein [Nitrospira sp.]|nr:DUF86 domain-containing protein [Nitrospira sp.]